MIFFIERHPGQGFQIFLTASVEVPTPISYLVVDPLPAEGPTRDPDSHD